MYCIRKKCLLFQTLRFILCRMKMRVRALILKNERFDNGLTQKNWDYNQMAFDPARRRGWISFDCLAYNPADDCVYCGLTDFNNDIFYRYHRRENRFESLNFQSIAEAHDAKFHRSLERDPGDGVLWAATALLHDVDRYRDAPGGAIVRFDPRICQLQKLCIPIPHAYIQSLVLDHQRGLLHGVTFTPEKLFTYDIETGAVRDHGLIGSGVELGQPEKPVLDQKGRLWCTWGVTRAFMSDTGPHPIRLLCLTPDTGEIVFYQHGLPPLGSYDKGHVEGMLSARDGFVYVGSRLGGFYRLNPDNAEVKYLGKPVPGERMTSMVESSDGSIYIACGRPDAYLVRFRPGPDAFEVLGLIKDEKTGEKAHQIHDLCMVTDDTFYAAENDNFSRSGYLWECRL
jgi:hypothetical protein